MDESAISRESWTSSAQAWIAAIEEGDLNRELLLDPVMLEWISGLPSGRVLDVGCGEGRFCRKLSSADRVVVGVDPIRALVGHASANGGVYVEGNGERLPFNSDWFDLAISYVALLDIPDYRAAVREMARVLRPGGHAVVANLNPLVTSQNGWIKNEAGERLHVAVDDYLSERGSLVSWADISVYNWHRPLQSYMSAFLDAGFLLRRYSEPAPSLEAIQASPFLATVQRVPWFHVMLLQKEG